MAKINKNNVEIGDIVFVNMNNVSYDNYVGKIVGMRGATKAIIEHGEYVQSAFINRCSHANESQRKEYFKGILRG